MNSSLSEKGSSGKKVEKVYSVSELTEDIKRLLESKFPLIAVEGEISNYKRYPSGHIYFTLKDEGAQLNAVIWRNTASNLGTEFYDGAKVIVKGPIRLYEPNGRYQIVVSYMRLIGLGELQIAFENLKNKLFKEGLFDQKHKKKIPKFPKKIGVVTSIAGAAIRDIVSVINRRYPVAGVIIFPTAVQGAGASEEIAEAIKNFNEYGKVDVIIVGRGGGSLEDLWAFNEEIVARAIFKSKIPIISAVGHEVDYTISDFVADLRAPTPSVAGEYAVPNKGGLIEYMNNQINSLYSYIDDMINDKRKHIENLVNNYAFRQPAETISRYRQRIDECMNVIEMNSLHKVELYKQSAQSLAKRLESVNPKSILKRGYCVIEKGDKIISKSIEVKQNDNVKLVFHDKSRQAKILDK